MTHLYKFMMALSVPILVVAFFLAALYLFQNKLLYIPARANIENYVPDGMVPWPAGPTDQVNVTPVNILGLLAEPASEQLVTGTAIVFHGNAGHAGHRTYYAQQLMAVGLRVILAEYPGYGTRSGKPDELLLVNDGIDIVKLAHQQFGEPIWLFGESLGAGVVAGIAGREPSLLQGLVMITPWNRLADVAAHHYPFLPVRWLLTSEYDSIQSLTLFDGPKLVIVADRDTIVPTDLGLDLYQEIDKPKRLIRIDGAGHNDWTMQASPSIWIDAMQWFRANQRSK